MLDLLRYAYELRDPSHLRVPGTNLKALRITEGEIRMAERLIAEMTEPWRPERYHDDYRDELVAFIKKRAKAGKLAAAPEMEEKPTRPRRGEVIDIADLLRKSLARAGPRKGEERRLADRLGDGKMRRPRDDAQPDFGY
jgi:DNA end-binding protein Ku